MFKKNPKKTQSLTVYIVIDGMYIIASQDLQLVIYLHFTLGCVSRYYHVDTVMFTTGCSQRWQ
jgi:hypothetical protein